MKVLEIPYQVAVHFLLPRHYSGRTPSISKAFGWYDGDELKAVCTFGKPSSPGLCKGICGEKYSAQVYELNRLCREEDLQKPLSQFVAECLRRLKPLNWIIVSYSDTAMNHHGYIYQATNFIYTGMTKERTDKYTENGKHSRHYSKDQDNSIRTVRSAKHRYIYICTNDKKFKKEVLNHLNYPIIKEYPKGNNSNYKLGDFIKPKLIKKELNNHDKEEGNSEVGEGNWEIIKSYPIYEQRTFPI